MPDVLDLLTEPDQVLIITPGEHPDLDRDARFEMACELYENVKVEMDQEGNIIVAPGSSEESGVRSGEAFGQLWEWARKDGTGRAFDTTTNFNLPSGAKRQPDAAWVPKTVLQQEGSAALRTITKTRHVPVYLIEVTSPSDSLAKQREKCLQWIEAGVQEAVLLHPKTQSAWVFRAGSVEEFKSATRVASAVLPGFEIDCLAVWEEL